MPSQIAQPRRFTWIVGNAVEKAFEPLVDQLNQVKGLEINLIAINSEYWGQEITVTGLLTGQDLLTNLSMQDLGDAILLPSLMLKHDETKFLDDMTVEEVSRKLNTTILTVSDVKDLIDQCIS